MGIRRKLIFPYECLCESQNMSGQWELGRNLEHCTFSCHLCGMRGFPNVQQLDQHCMVTCPRRDNDIDWGNPDDWLERSTVRSDESFNNEHLYEDSCDASSAETPDESPIDPALDTSTAVDPLKCPICMDNKIGLVSQCGHGICHTCCAGSFDKGLSNCPSCRDPWSRSTMRRIFI